MDKNSKGEERDYSMLTEQQMEILTEEGMPLNYNSLTSNQQMYLRTADEMLTYINEKYAPYKIHFTYLAYHSPELLDSSTKLIVVPDGYDPSIDVVTIKKNDDAEEGYEDDYLDFIARIEYEKVITNHLAEMLPTDKFRVYATNTAVDNIQNKNPSFIDYNYIMQTPLSSVDYIYISESVCDTEEYFRIFTMNYIEWLHENGFKGTYTIYVYRDEGIESLSPQNHSSTRKEYAIMETYGHSNDYNIPFTLNYDSSDYLDGDY